MTSPTVQFTSGQTIKGWGLYPGGGPNPFFENSAAQAAVYALKPMFVRDQIDPALFVSGTRLDNIVLNTPLFNQYIAKIAAAKAAGVSEYILSIWSPPASMKTPALLPGGVLTNEALFVAFVVRVLQALQTSSIGLPVALSIQNEPEVTAAYASCVYTPETYARVLVDVFGACQYAKIPVRLIGPETGMYTPALPYLSGPTWPLAGYALHTYGQCAIIPLNAALHSGRDAWMTEFSQPNGSTELAWTLDMMAALAAHVVLVPFNYWAWWIGYAASVGPPDAGTLIGGETTAILSKRYYALQKLWSLVTPGWIVRPVVSHDPDLPASLGTQDPCTARVNVVAFSAPDESKTVIQIVNRTMGIKSVTVGGLPGIAQTSWVSDATRDMAALSVSNIIKGMTTIAVPPESVVLVLCQ
jgi:O-glycosyl hydrolase